MKFYIDASIFLQLLLDEEKAEDAEKILLMVEEGEASGYISPLVVEEVVFKLLVARASELGVMGFYEFKRLYLRKPEFRAACFEPVLKFMGYLNSLTGLKWLAVDKDVLDEALDICEKYGLLPADSVHAALALKLQVPIATFDEDFRNIPELEVIP